MIVEAKKLTPDNVKPYGSMISVSAFPPQKSRGPFTWHGTAGVIQVPSVSVNLCSMEKHDCVLDEMEYHTATSEALIAIKGSGFIVALAPAGILQPEKIEAFYIPAGEGIIFNYEIYHSTPFPTEGATDFIVIFAEGTGANDLVKEKLGEPITITKN